MDNVPVQSLDLLGLCPKQCGVKSMVFKPHSTTLPSSSGGWTLIFRGAIGTTILYDVRYVFAIDITLLQDKDHDPRSCRYVQLVQATASVNGRPITKSDRGVPADGELHLDGNWKTPPGWTDDNIKKHLDLWPIPTSTRYYQTDRPGLSKVPTGS